MLIYCYVKCAWSNKFTKHSLLEEFFIKSIVFLFFRKSDRCQKHGRRLGPDHRPLRPGPGRDHRSEGLPQVDHQETQPPGPARRHTSDNGETPLTTL